MKKKAFFGKYFSKIFFKKIFFKIVFQEKSQTNVFWKLGFPEVHCVSATRFYGLKDLVSLIEENLKDAKSLPWAYQKAENAVKVSIIGRPNAGKSTLINSLSLKDRVIVSPLAGTTIDAINVPIEFGERKYELFDTAGIRKGYKTKTNIEYFSYVRAMHAASESDITILLIDADSGLVDQDLKILSSIFLHWCSRFVFNSCVIDGRIPFRIVYYAFLCHTCLLHPS